MCIRDRIDPFAFLTSSLQLPAIPAPDVTTENGRRLFFSHIDGDGFPSLSESPGNPPAGDVLLKEILEKYRVPTTMSVIEAETSPQGLYPKMSQQLEAIARRIFRLSHVEIASHTYTHPFRWDNSVRHGIFQEDKEAVFHLEVPGYEFDLTRESLARWITSGSVWRRPTSRLICCYGLAILHPARMPWRLLKKPAI